MRTIRWFLCPFGLVGHGGLRVGRIGASGATTLNPPTSYDPHQLATLPPHHPSPHPPHHPTAPPLLTPPPHHPITTPEMSTRVSHLRKNWNQTVFTFEHPRRVVDSLKVSGATSILPRASNTSHYSVLHIAPRVSRLCVEPSKHSQHSTSTVSIRLPLHAKPVKPLHFSTTINHNL